MLKVNFYRVIREAVCGVLCQGVGRVDDERFAAGFFSLRGSRKNNRSGPDPRQRLNSAAPHIEIDDQKLRVKSFDVIYPMKRV